MKHGWLLTIYVMLYIGYPITYNTAWNLFPIAYSNDRIRDSDILYNYLQSFQLDLYYVDNDQWILGICVSELCDMFNNFKNVDNSLELIARRTQTVIQSLQNARADLLDFELESLNGRKQRVHSPKPYLFYG